MKQAKSEAEAEIAMYTKQRETQFEVFAKDRQGDSGAHKLELTKQKEAELASIASSMQANKGKVIEMLLASVQTVG